MSLDKLPFFVSRGTKASDPLSLGLRVGNGTVWLCSASGDLADAISTARLEDERAGREFNFGRFWAESVDNFASSGALSELRDVESVRRYVSALLLEAQFIIDDVAAPWSEVQSPRMPRLNEGFILEKIESVPTATPTSGAKPTGSKVKMTFWDKLSFDPSKKGASQPLQRGNVPPCSAGRLWSDKYNSRKRFALAAAENKVVNAPVDTLCVAVPDTEQCARVQIEQVLVAQITHHTNKSATDPEMVESIRDAVGLIATALESVSALAVGLPTFDAVKFGTGTIDSITVPKIVVGLSPDAAKSDKVASRLAKNLTNTRLPFRVYGHPAAFQHLRAAIYEYFENVRKVIYLSHREVDIFFGMELVKVFVDKLRDEIAVQIVSKLGFSDIIETKDRTLESIEALMTAISKSSRMSTDQRKIAVGRFISDFNIKPQLERFYVLIEKVSNAKGLNYGDYIPESQVKAITPKP